MSSEISKGGKEARLKEGGGGKGGQKGALQTSPATCRHPGVTGLFPGLPEKGGLELGPTRNQTRIRVLCQEEVISLQPSAQAEALRPDSCVQDRGTRKPGGWEGLRRGRREGRREVSKVSRSSPVGHSGQLSASGGDQGQKGPSCGRWVWSVARQAGP